MYFSQCKSNEMSAIHAGTRKWQKVINHEKDATVVTADDEYAKVFILSATHKKENTLAHFNDLLIYNF